MNPNLDTLQPYPFQRLRDLFKDVSPNPDLAPINLSIGEPKHETPATRGAGAPWTWRPKAAAFRRASIRSRCGASDI